MTHPHDDHSQHLITLQVAEETLRQTRATFDLTHRCLQAAFIMTVASALVSLTGVGLLLTHRASEGAIATAGGLASGGGFLALTKEAEERLKRANKRLDKILTAVPDEE
ncbi:MAG: hypothetical protein KME43_24590 [Myxacorys chilensis ATA2-1-KO14]|jgi:hypothetical protein|nr:hypothetical protein [Myxacorys chilensis ATA2-1-KO14]